MPKIFVGSQTVNEIFIFVIIIGFARGFESLLNLANESVVTQPLIGNQELCTNVVHNDDASIMTLHS